MAMPDDIPGDQGKYNFKEISLIMTISFWAVLLLRFFKVIVWPWPVMVLLAIVVMILVPAFVSTIRSMRTSDGPVQFNPQINHFSDSLEHILHLIDQGDFQNAETVVYEALANLPPTEQCSGIIAHHRFSLLANLADILRKQDKDVAREFELLSECVLLLEKNPLPPPIPGPDRRVNLTYIIHMNRAIATGKLGKYEIEEDALAKAFQAARDPETRCKSLCFQVWAILKQQDESKFGLAWNLVTQFDQIAAGEQIPSELRVGIETGRVVLALSSNDLDQARRACADARHIDPSFPGNRELTQVLTNPQVTAHDAKEQIMNLIMDNMAGQYTEWRPIKPSLSPLTIKLHSKNTDNTSLSS